jgi:membrane-associated phospholipid phosphatase
MTASGVPGIDKASEPAALRRACHRGFVRLRVSEKLILVFLAYLTLAAWLFRVDAQQRWLILGSNGLACAVIAALSRFDQPVRNRTPRGQDRSAGRLLTLAPPHGSRLLADVRHWLPLALILVAYRESGLFVRPDLSHRLDQLFVIWDRYMLGNEWTLRAIAAGGPWLTGYLEIAYLLCYPLVPMGLAAVLIHDQRTRGSFVQIGDHGQGGVAGRESVDEFWTTVLLAAFCAYAAFPFFPLTPPRVLYHDLPGASFSFWRGANLWLLDHYGVQACIFPSGHVAVVTATALAVRRKRPRLGLVFLWAAFSIAVATVLLRYHYAADTLAGAAVGVAAGLVSRRIHVHETN